MAKPKKEITFKYVYPDNLQDLYVNGLWGGVTPRNEIYVHFYSERLPIPKVVTHEVVKGNILGKEISAEKGGDVLRLIQASLMMDVQTAIAFRDWLDKRIEYINNTENKKGKTHGARNK